MDAEAELVGVSVVIAAYNEAAQIARLVELAGRHAGRATMEQKG